MVDDGMEILTESEEIIEDGWKIENDQMADWAVKKIQSAKAELDRWTRYYNGLIDKVSKSTENTISFMTARLAEYFQTVPHKETKTMEKYPLPSGELIMKKPKEVFIHDDGTLLEWLKKNELSELVKVKESPDWSGVKKRLTVDPKGVVCDSETGLVCDVVTVGTDNGGFEVKT